MDKLKPRKNLARVLAKNRSLIVRLWSSRIFEVPGHRRVKDIVPVKVHAAGMDKFVRAMIYDIKNNKERRCPLLIKKLVLKDYLSVNTVEDTIHGLIIFRGIIDSVLVKSAQNDFITLQAMRAIAVSKIDREILCFSTVYKKRDFVRMETVIRYGKKLIAMHDFDRLCHFLLEAAIKESNSDRASLMLLKEGSLYIKSAIGLPKRIVASAAQKLGSGIAGRVAKTGRPIIINEGQKISPGIKRSLRGAGLASAVSIPLINHEQKLIGVLNLGKYRRKPFFDNEDLRLLLLLAYEGGAAISNCRLFQALENHYIGTVYALASAIEARDHYTHGHSNRVGKLSAAIARKLNLTNGQVENIICAGRLHDIGKIGIPDNILLKPSRLSMREYEVIKKHPVVGVEILRHIPRLKAVLPIIYHEHEHYNGKGYVDGIKGNKIPIESRIIAVADAYEAMTSNRPYRKALSRQEAIRELKRVSGTQFDPVVVKAFIATIKKRRR